MYNAMQSQGSRRQLFQFNEHNTETHFVMIQCLSMLIYLFEIFLGYYGFGFLQNLLLLTLLDVLCPGARDYITRVTLIQIPFQFPGFQ